MTSLEHKTFASFHMSFDAILKSTNLYKRAAL